MVTREPGGAATCAVRVDEVTAYLPRDCGSPYAGATVYAVQQALTIAGSGSGVASAEDFVPVNDFTLIIGAEAAEAAAPFTRTPVDYQHSKSDETIILRSDYSIVLTNNDGPTSTD